MPTTRTVSFDYPHAPAQLAALLQDTIYLRHRSEAAGERNAEIRVEPQPDGLRITFSREKDLDIPVFARPIVGSRNRAIEITLWRAEGPGFSAEFSLEVPGIPVRARGRSTFVPSAGGCRYTSTFEVTADLPLIAGKVERLVADGLLEDLAAHAQRNAEALGARQRGARSFIEAVRVPETAGEP